MQASILTMEITQKVDLIQHLAANSDRIPLVRGIHGVGKSTLLDQLLQQAPKEWDIYRIDATPMLQQDQLVHGLFGHFSKQEYLENITQLVQRFADLKQMGRLPVIIVDDTEQLPVTALTALFDIYSKSYDLAGGLSLILFASPQIDDLLEDMSPRSAVDKLQVLELFPLDREQSDQLARHFIKILGAEQEVSVSEAEYDGIFRASNGLPGKIRQQIEKLMQPKTTTPIVPAKKRNFLPQLLADVSTPVLIGGGILAVLLLLTLIFEEEINKVFEPDNTFTGQAGLETNENRRVVPLDLPDNPIRVERDELMHSDRDDVTSDLEEITAGQVDISADPDTSSKPLGDKDNEVTMPLAVELPQLTSQQRVEHINEPEILEKSPLEPSSAVDFNTTNYQADKAASENVSVDQDLPETTEALEAAVVKQVMSAAPETSPNPPVKSKTQKSSPAPVTELGRTKRPEVKTEPAAVALAGKRKKPSPAPVQENSIRREAWLLKQSPDAYTLQLIGAGDEQAVTSFIRRHRLQGNAAYFRTKSNGRPWFPVLYGLYPSRSAAVAARAKLPGKLATKDVWPRSMASVHQAIKGK